jgi:arginase family enzyme
MANDPPTFAIPPGFLGIGRRERDAAIAVAGIPLDIGTTNRSGARFGPQAIRHASRMLVDGAHPTTWINPAELMLSDIGDFRIALGDIPASLKTIEEQAAAVDYRCVYRKPHPAMNLVLADENPCSCARISCSAEIIPCFVE